MDGQLTIAIEDPRSPDGRAIVKRFFTDIVGRYWSRAATLAEVGQAGYGAVDPWSTSPDADHHLAKTLSAAKG